MRNIRLGRMCPKEINTLAYYTKALITAVKSFLIKDWQRNKDDHHLGFYEICRNHYTKGDGNTVVEHSTKT